MKLHRTVLSLAWRTSDLFSLLRRVFVTVPSHAESQRETLPACRSAYRLLLQCSGRDQCWIFDRLGRDPTGAVV